MSPDFFVFNAYEITITIMVAVIGVVLWIIKKKIQKVDEVPQTYTSIKTHEKDMAKIWENHEKDVGNINSTMKTMEENMRRESKDIKDGVAYNKEAIGAVHTRLDDLIKWFADHNSG